MRLRFCWFIVGALLGAAEADTVADGCEACHRGELSLAEWSAGDLRDRLEALRREEDAHVVPIPRLSEAELEALIAVLTEP